MACLIDQVAVFGETGKGSVTCPSSFPGEPSDFSVSLDGQNLNYVGLRGGDEPTWAKGGTADNPIFPAVLFYTDLDGCWFIAAESESTPIVGEHRISMCDSESGGSFDVAILNINDTDYNIRDEVARTNISSKQDTLVSGTNIKTINGTSLLGSGNIEISGGSDEKVQQTNTTSNVGYPVILANSANAATETAGVKKSLGLTFDPAAKELLVDDNPNSSLISPTGFGSTVGENSVFLNPSELVFTDNSAYAYIGEQVTAGVYNWINTSKDEHTLHGIGLSTRIASQYKFSFETSSNGIRLYKYARQSYADGSIQEDNYVTDHAQLTCGGLYLRTYTYDETTTGGSVNEMLHITPTYIDVGTTSGGFSRITKNKIDTWDSYTDTKNTTGSTNTSSKIFLVGATSQAANPVTYSHDTAYVGTDGHLYSNSRQVVNVSNTQTLTNKTLTSPAINEPAVSNITTVTQVSFWTENSANTESVTSFAAYRWGNLISVRMNIKTTSTVSTSTTTTLGTVGANYKSATLVYANTRSHTSPYAPYTGGAVWITGDTISCRLPASTWVNLSLVYLINPNA